MSTFDFISAKNLGSPVPAAIGGMGIGDTLSDSSTFTPTSLGSNAWWKISANAAAPASVSSEPTTIFKTGFIALVGGATTWNSGANGYYIGNGTISSGTWTMTLNFTEGTGNVSTQVIGFRAYQVSADLSSSTLIAGIGNTNGWKYGASVTATTNGYTITATSVPAVSISASTPYLYIEIVVNTTAQTTGVTACTLARTSLAIPAIAYTRNPSESLTTTDTPTRAGSTFNRSQSESLTTSDTPSRIYNAIRTIAESVGPASDSVARVFTGARTITEAPITDDAVTRIFNGTRIVTETLTTADIVTRKAQFNRAITENLTSGGGSTTVIKIFPIMD